MKLNLKQQIILKELIDIILSKNIKWLDIKKISWKPNFYRCRTGQIRIIFYEENEEYFIFDIDFRWRIYKGLK